MGSESRQDDEVAGFLADVRATYVSMPEEAVASRHLAAIAREAELVLPRRTTGAAGWRIVNRNRFARTAVALGAATLAAVFGAAGLAAAGVDLPDQAQDAFNKVGISLPNQAGGGQSGEHSRSDEVHSVIETTPPSERGCAFGHAVAEAAKGSPLPEQAQGACEKANEDGDADENSNSSHSDFGHDTAERAKGQKDATVEERKSFGQDTAEQAQDLGGAPNGAEQRGEAPDTGDAPGAPEGTPTGPPEGTPNGPDTAPIPQDTPGGPPEGTPSGRP